MDWREKDRWNELAGMSEAQFEAEASGSLAAWKKDIEIKLMQDIALIDAQKTKVKATSLEGLLKVKLAMLERIQLMRGDATRREERVVVVFRKEVRVERKETGETPCSGAPGNMDLNELPKGVTGGGNQKLAGLLELIRGESEEPDVDLPFRPRVDRRAEVQARLLKPDPSEDDTRAIEIVEPGPTSRDGNGAGVEKVATGAEVRVLPAGSGTREDRRTARRMALGLDMVNDKGEQVRRTS
jgi:hypothetical protein